MEELLELDTATDELLGLLEDEETVALELLGLLLLELGAAMEELLGLEPGLFQSDSGISFTSSLYAAFLAPEALKSKGFLLLRQD